jgi:hypothetical protein
MFDCLAALARLLRILVEPLLYAGATRLRFQWSEF